MDIRSILVSLDDSAHARARLEFAIAFAQSRGASLTGAHISYLPMAAGTGDLEAMVIRAREVVREAQKAAAKDFREKLARSDVRGEFFTFTNAELKAAVQMAMAVDLLIAGQYEEGIAAAESDVFSVKALLGSGRPVLYVPLERAVPTEFRHILLAWNGSREAVRAIHDALPFLQQAEQVSVISVQPLDGRHPDYRESGKRLVANLARHGVEADYTVIDIAGSGSHVDEWLTQQTQRDDVDLLVAGGYGHGRATEFLLGGVTRSLLHHMAGPVLLSH